LSAAGRAWPLLRKWPPSAVRKYAAKLWPQYRARNERGDRFDAWAGGLLSSESDTLDNDW
jgi:hypothetical protein